MITVIDAPCGAGKTNKVIEIMQNNLATRYVYITPFLTECERITSQVKNTKSPTVKNKHVSKLYDFINMLQNSDCNISSTHSLFERFNSDIADMIKSQKMTLILDEVMDVVEQIPEDDLHSNDVEQMLKTGLIQRDKVTGRLIWTAEGYTGNDHHDSLELIKNSYTYAIKFKKEEFTCFIWTFPPDIFEAFDNIIICTYMFHAQLQRFYYDLYKIPYVVKTLKDNEFVDINDYEKEVLPRFLDKIHIYEGQANIIGEMKPFIMLDEYDILNPWYSALSKTWFNDLTDPAFRRIKTSISTVVQRYFKNPPVKDVMWTTFKSYRKQLKGKGYATKFLPCTARAQNDYANCKYVIYMVNRYIAPAIKHFFHLQGISFTNDMEDEFALSELIQFIYRSAVRNGEDVYVYIPSRRMRKLLQKHIRKYVKPKIRYDMPF